MSPLITPPFATRLRSSDVAEETHHESEKRRSLLFSRCSKSGIRGFTSSKRLTGGLFLHWRATTKGSEKVKLALLATTGSLAAHGWFSAGWSPDGKMGGSNVIVMDSPSSPPVTADLIGHAVSGSPATWTAADTSVTIINMGIIMKFSRAKGDAGVPVKLRGRTHIVWAFGLGAWSPSGPHVTRGATVVNFSCDCRGVSRIFC
ncbi:unnamed protein product [Closterium sp. NIES-64]|nr:unnamed protein product [Closterium sp. NIES-64]